MESSNPGSTSTPSPVSSPQINEEINKHLTYHTNLGQDVIIIDANKVRLILHNKYEGLRAEREWATPSAICLTLIITLVSAQFKPTTWGMDASTWHAIFVIGALSGGWSIRCLVNAYKKRGENTIEAIVTELLNSRPS